MSQNHNKVTSWIPALLWMLLIFILSSRPRIGITHISGVDFIIFKSLHVIEYGILYLLVFRGIYRTSRSTLMKQLLVAFIISFFYAVSDEVHQTFVATREGKVRDIAIDTVGITMSFLLIRFKGSPLLEILRPGERGSE